MNRFHFSHLINQSINQFISICIILFLIYIPWLSGWLGWPVIYEWISSTPPPPTTPPDTHYPPWYPLPPLIPTTPPLPPWYPLPPPDLHYPKCMTPPPISTNFLSICSNFRNYYCLISTFTIVYTLFTFYNILPSKFPHICIHNVHVLFILPWTYLLRFIISKYSGNALWEDTCGEATIPLSVCILALAWYRCNRLKCPRLDCPPAC